ncbi:MAG: CoA transferase [Candidatus Lambdaproteobacteria bacterium]|nr:CoA transferase [Candidatus Lambdaproteobacteria bacterium]
MPGMLSGVRVLEIANWIAAPTAAALMADLGADVIKVEPPEGDPYRVMTHRVKEMGFPFTYSPNFQLGNRGKRSIAVDLRRPEAVAVILDIAAGCDVFLCNLLPERREKYGLAEDEIAARNPRIIDISLTGYGASGPERNRPGFDFAAFWGRAGIMTLIGEEGSSPASQRGGMGDHTTALNVLTAILACLRLRDATGRGQRAQVSLVNTGLWVLGANIAQALVDRRQPPRHDRRAPPDPLVNSYPTADGRWLVLGLAESQPLWPALCRALGREALVADVRFATADGRQRNAAALVRELEAAFATRPLEDWRPLLDGAGLPWDPVLLVTEVAADEQARRMGRYTDLDDPVHGRFTTLAAPFNLSEGLPAPTRSAPQIGQHTDDVLREIGYDEARVRHLRERRVVGVPAT